MFVNQKMMWRISSLHNPARNRQLSINTWVHSAVKQRDVSAYQKTQLLAYRHTQPKAHQFFVIPDNLPKSPAEPIPESTTEPLPKCTTDAKTETTKPPSNTVTDPSTICDACIFYAYSAGFCLGSGLGSFISVLFLY